MSKIIHFSEETEITIKDVVDSMTDLQREAMYGIIGKVWTAEPNAPAFIHYFAKLGYIALNITHENFLAIQQLRSNILNDYTAGKLSDSEKRTIYRASTIIMNYMREELHNNGTEKNPDGTD